MRLVNNPQINLHCCWRGEEAEAVPLACCNIQADSNLLDLWLAFLGFTPDICCG